MESTPNGLPVSLLADSSQVRNELSLLALINRINDERGGLLDLTEEGLRQELAEADAGILQEDNDLSDEDEEPDSLKELMETKEVMKRNLEYPSLAPNYQIISL